MARSLDLQTCGSVLVVGAFAASEIAERLLSAYPGSAFAWFLSFGVFRPFETLRAEMPLIGPLFGPGSLPAALCVLAFTLVARRRNMRLAVAAVANLSFLFALALASSMAGLPRPPSTASLVAFGGDHGADAALVAILLAGSSLAFGLSHLSFIREIAGRTDRLGESRSRS